MYESFQAAPFLVIPTATYAASTRLLKLRVHFMFKWATDIPQRASKTYCEFNFTKNIYVEYKRIIIGWLIVPFLSYHLKSHTQYPQLS